MLLPHEILYALADHAFNPAALLCQEGLSQQGHRHLTTVASEFGVDPKTLIPLGLWGDGVPFNFDRSESLECFTLKLPGLTGVHEHTRMPSAVISRKYLLNQHTFDDIVAVLTWSLQMAASGIMPSSRHDNSQFNKQDSWRRKAAGKPCPRAVLCDFRGDWVFYKQLMRFPQHNENNGCCWRCSVTPQTWRECGLEAPWRTQRLSHWQLLRRMLDQGLTLSPLWGAPGLRSDCFAVNWLHTADKGVAATFLGSYFKYVAGKFPGNNEHQRVSSLFLDIKQWYEENGVTSRLDNLKVTMLGKKGKTPCLSCKAAEARFLVPYAKQSADKLLGNTPEELTIKEMASELFSCYDCLSKSTYNKELLATSCRRFYVLAVAMEARSESKMWGLRPKLHLFQELCETAESNPSLTWTYRDEDFGGTLSAMAARRGGADTPLALGRTVLLKFVTRNSLPRMDVSV